METSLTWEIKNVKNRKELLSLIKDKHLSFLPYDWLLVTMSKYFDFKMVPMYKEHLNWQYICTFYSVPHNILKNYSDYFDWYSISAFQNLGLSLIRKYKNQLSFDILKDNREIEKAGLQSTVLKMYDKMKDNPEHVARWELNRQNSIFVQNKKPIVRVVKNEDHPDVPKKRNKWTYKPKELDGLTKADLKVILDRFKVKYYYKDTVQELKNKILSFKRK